MRTLRAVLVGFIVLGLAGWLLIPNLGTRANIAKGDVQDFIQRKTSLKSKVEIAQIEAKEYKERIKEARKDISREEIIVESIEAEVERLKAELQQKKTYLDMALTALKSPVQDGKININGRLYDRSRVEADAKGRFDDCKAQEAKIASKENLLKSKQSLITGRRAVVEKQERLVNEYKTTIERLQTSIQDLETKIQLVKLEQTWSSKMDLDSDSGLVKAIAALQDQELELKAQLKAGGESLVMPDEGSLIDYEGQHSEENLVLDIEGYLAPAPNEPATLQVLPQ